MTLSDNAEQALDLPQRHHNSDQGYALIHPEDVEHHRALVTKAIATQGSYVSQYRHAHGERVIWLEEWGNSVTDQQGKTIRLVGVVQNVTERKRAEEALQRSEQKYRQLFGSMTEGFLLIEMILDEAGKPVSYRYLDANPALERLTHLKCKDIIGKDVRQVLGVIEGHWIRAFGQVAMTGKPAHIEEFSQALDGWYDVYVYCPEPGQAALIYTNVTERKRAEEALKLTQASIDGAAEMVAWFRPDGSIHYVNDATCRSLGYSREEMLKMNALDFSPGFTREQYEEHWREVRARKSFTLRPVHRRKDGSTYTGEVLVNHVVHGGQDFVFAYGRDITER